MNSRIVTNPSWINTGVVVLSMTLAIGLTAFANDLKIPIASPDLVFEEVDRIVAVEAEHFYKQALPEPFPELAEPAPVAETLPKDEAKKSGSLSLNAKDFIDNAQGYYLDKGKWLAIHPEKNKQASTRTSSVRRQTSPTICRFKAVFS